MRSKYYIGYELPDHIREKIRGLYLHVMGDCRLEDTKQLHITALHIGEATLDHAVKVFSSVPHRKLPISCKLDTYDKFGMCLVIKLQQNEALTVINKILSESAGKRDEGNGWGYNPHITIAKNARKAFIRTACPDDGFDISGLSLFEKPEGGEYSVYGHHVWR